MGGTPKAIYIIRHGEKPGTPDNDNDGGPDVSIKGSARAASLPSLFVPTNVTCQLVGVQLGVRGFFIGAYSSGGVVGSAPRFATPDFLFATKKSSDSNRPAETITPLSVALNLTVNETYSATQYSQLAAEIKNNSTYIRKIVMICWHHSTILELACEFGELVPRPKKWDRTVFDRVWEIASTLGPPFPFKNHPQCLLYGDSEA
jgi:hypothetical protein